MHSRFVVCNSDLMPPKSEYKPPAPSLLFEYVLNPFYSWIVEFYPRWWTPNGITIFGICCTLWGSMMIVAETFWTSTDATDGTPRSGFFDPNLQFGVFPLNRSVWLEHERATKSTSGQHFSEFLSEATPRWILVIAGVLHLVYCVADNTDGKQARRLGKGSAIGEYLDHGLDCVTAMLSTYGLITVGGASVNCASFGQYLVVLAQILAHLLNYKRGVLIWGNRFLSVDEAMISFGLFPLMVALWPGYRRCALPSVIIPLLGIDLGNYRLADALWISYLIGQVSMMIDVLKQSRALALRGVVFATAGLCVFMAGVAGPIFHAGGTAAGVDSQLKSVHSLWYGLVPGLAKPSHSGISGLLMYIIGVFYHITASYPALWATTFAFCSSTLIHVPIIAKCRHLSEMQQRRPIQAVGIALGLFALSPPLGCLAAIGFHVVQIAVNIRAIQSDANVARK